MGRKVVEFNMKFLLVDDNEINLEFQKVMLENCGFTVVTANNGKQAIELARKNDFFMIFMDIQMPETDGFTAASCIREFNKSVPIIALSADEIGASDDNFVKSKMSGSIKKPIDFSELNELISRYSDTIHKDTDLQEQNSDAVFDYDELFSIIKDEDIILQMLQQFLSVHILDCGKIAKYIDEKNFIGAREILHNIIGVSGNLRCIQLYELSLVLGNQLRQERSDSFARFSDVWQTTIDEICNVYDKLSSKHEVTDTDVDWESLWSDFRSMCYDFEVSAQNLFMKNVNAFMEHMSSDDFEKLRKAVVCYDFLWINDHLEELNVSSTVS